MKSKGENPSFFIEYIAPRERIILLCPSCGVAEGVDKERWATQSIFNSSPPVCTQCGDIFIPFEEQSL